MSEIYKGNAYEDGEETRGWIVGPFMPEGMHYEKGLEIKWAAHAKGETRETWATDEERKALCVLISGRYAVKFREQDVLLENPGDYVMWEKGSDHTWEALDDSVIMTVRWNLSANDQGDNC